jgi:hypothetical protein
MWSLLRHFSVCLNIHNLNVKIPHTHTHIYIQHRYRNLLLRLFLPFAFGNLLIVTLWAESFVVLYVTTLALPAFLAFAHLPPVHSNQ